MVLITVTTINKGTIMLNKETINKLISLATMHDYKLNYYGLCMLLAQCDHESAGFTRVEENLRYTTPERICTIFPRYFQTGKDSNGNYIPDLDKASQYINDAPKLGNYVYANRMGNGDVDSGDGYKHRGFGYIQLTGKDNQGKCGEALGLDLLNHPELLCQSQNAMKSALWFFQTKGIINNTDIREVTKVVNGGYHGLLERDVLFDKYKKLFNI
jgi:putative chitinase